MNGGCDDLSNIISGLADVIRFPASSGCLVAL